MVKPRTSPEPGKLCASANQNFEKELEGHQSVFAYVEQVWCSCHFRGQLSSAPGLAFTSAGLADLVQSIADLDELPE